MSKEKGKRFDTSHDSDYDFDIEPDPDAASAVPIGFDFEVTSRPMSKKGRQAAAKAAAKAAEEAEQKAAADATKRVVEERQRLLTLFPQFAPKPVLPTPRPSVTCETCGAPKPEGAVGWRESTLGFSSKGICPACFRQANAHRFAPPKLVWLDQPDSLSVWRDKLVEKSSKKTDSPNDMLKARLQGLSTLRPMSLNARKKLLMQTMRELTMEKLKEKEKDKKDKKGGTRRKSKSKSKSKSRRKST